MCEQEREIEKGSFASNSGALSVCPKGPWQLHELLRLPHAPAPCKQPIKASVPSILFHRRRCAQPSSACACLHAFCS